jgi:hypothetical protein
MHTAAGGIYPWVHAHPERHREGGLPVDEPPDADSEGRERKVIRAGDPATDKDLATEDPTQFTVLPQLMH